jgi:hypothetical protein
MKTQINLARWLAVMLVMIVTSSVIAQPYNQNPTQTVCVGEQPYFVDPSPIVGTNYVWTVSAGGTIISGDGTPNIVINWTVPGGPYTVSVYTEAAGCIGNTVTVDVTVTDDPSATIDYAGNPFCITSSPVAVTLVGSAGGVFSALPAGLTIDPSTGTITPATSLAGTYVVSYDIAGTNFCSPFNTTTSVTITEAPDATILYAGDPFCTSSAPVAVTLTGDGGGTYSASPAGLTIDAATGTITPATSTPGLYTVTYTIAAGGGCPEFSTTASVTITEAPDASILYAGDPFCTSSTPVTVTLTGDGGGTYSASPAGLTIDAVTGTITPATSTPGLYTVTYTIAAGGGCPEFSTTASVTITEAPDASILYAGDPFCTSSTPVTVTLTGDGGGTYSASPAGLTIDAVTGTITPATSTPGLYTVTYTIAAGGGCPEFNTTTSVTITEAPDATILYAGDPFCTSSAPVTVTLTGDGGGTYSALPAGLTIDPVTGTITPATSTPGSYTVTYTIAAGGGCSEFNTTTSVTITEAPDASILYAGDPFCTSSTPVTVTLTGDGGGTYSALPAGLTIDPATGTITPATSTPGTYTVTYTIASGGGCPEFTTTTTVTITEAPTATIAYAGNPFCSTDGPVVVDFTGDAGGTYTATPGGLSIDSVTGTITPSTSTPGTFTVTYTIAAGGGCPEFTVSTTVTINQTPTTSPIWHN